MAVVIETTLGDITVDLFLDQRPVTCLNFLKLCKMKYYNFNLFHSIRSGFIAQTGDPSGEGSGGQSIFGLLEGPTKRFFSGEKMPKIRHTNAGFLSMVCTDDMMVGSQFFFTLAPDLDSLDGVHCVIGEVTEGHEVLRKLNEVICDENHRPYQDVRITHTVVLEDPFNDPNGFRAPSRSPSPSAERLKGGRIAPDEEIDETHGKTAEEVQEIIEEKEAKARATILEIVGDLPDADIAPPENVLFVCKLNPVTTDEDLEIIFSRFGKIVNCEVIRDKKTGDSLQYAFIEFTDKKSCEDAYFKMDNVLIDDRRIHVDFSQSVSKMKWLGKGRGVKYFNSDDDIINNHNNSRSNRSQSRDRKKSKNSNHDNKNSRDKKYENKHHHDNRDRHHKLERDTKYRRERSQSRSEGNSRDKDNRNNTHKHSSRSDEKAESNERRNRNRENHSNSYKSRSKHSSSRNSKSEIRKSPVAKNRNKTEIQWAENDGNHNNRAKQVKSNKEPVIEESKNKVKKRRMEEDSELSRSSKKFKKNDKVEPRTPTPSRKLVKNEKDSKNMKKNRSVKKKRKPSTSSSSDSSDSSSSSSSTSSSEEDRKKKRNRRRGRKHCSSSSSDSSDSSSSSSTSSDSSSGSSTSSTDSEPSRKKKSRCPSKKTVDKKSNKKK